MSCWIRTYDGTLPMILRPSSQNRVQALSCCRPGREDVARCRGH